MGLKAPRALLSSPCIVTDIVCSSDNQVVWSDMHFPKEGCSESLCPCHPAPDEPMDLLNGINPVDRGHRHNLSWCRGWLLTRGEVPGKERGTLKAHVSCEDIEGVSEGTCDLWEH